MSERNMHHTFCIGKFTLEQLADRNPVTLTMEDGTMITLLDASDFPRAPAAEREALSAGWLFHNPDTGTELSINHPVESGECPDAANIRRTSVKELEVELRLACDQRDCAIGEIVDLQYRVASLEAALRDAPQLFKIALYGKIDADGNIVPMPEENDDWSTRWIGGTQDYELARAVCAAAAALADATGEKP